MWKAGQKCAETDSLVRMSIEMTAAPTHDTLGPLLNVLAQSLDVREVFARVSALARQTIPHDGLMFGLITADGERYRILASSEVAYSEDESRAVEDESRAVLRESPLSALSRRLLKEDFTIVHHVQTLPGKTWGCTGQMRTASSGVDEPFEWHPNVPWARGYESWIRLTVRLRGGVLGFLNVLSRAPEQYTEADVPAARRIGDLVALAFAHERLAEEEGRRAAAQERAVRLEARVASLTAELEAEGHHAPVGSSKSWRAVLAQAAKVAPAETTVLLTGESGTGKEVVAHLIHRGSRRADGPFVAVNCAALPEALLESELFGSEKGAFTGAVSAHAGRLEQAGGGTLFLDEVGEMSPAVQAKFLRVLEEREFQRLGGTRLLKADVRVIAATNRDLQAALAQGTFREDLYYRLHVFAIHLPPLRERREDILPLLEHFVGALGPVVLGRPAAGMSREARAHLLAYSWPGNVRELRNAVERALILCEGGLINPEHLPWHAEATMSAPPPAPPSSPAPIVPSAVEAFPAHGVDLEAMERTLIEGALKQAGQNRSKAAKLLGLSRSKLYTRLERFGLA
jgi:transcriptional regulator with GAF, ATPase, and Fis domain